MNDVFLSMFKREMLATNRLLHNLQDAVMNLLLYNLRDYSRDLERQIAVIEAMFDAAVAILGWQEAAELRDFAVEHSQLDKGIVFHLGWDQKAVIDTEF